MTDLWEEMMFDLEIQSPGEPGNHFIMGSKVGGGHYLMDGPFIFNAQGRPRSIHKMSDFHQVSQLEDGGQCYTQYQVHQDKSNDACPETEDADG